MRRRVFFSFHYQQDIWRANQVRQAWRYNHESERESEGFYDGSIWESSKRQGDESLKNLIREGIKNTSVTCVLSGTHTYQRRWVRYEIARSIIKGNGVLTLKIHSMRDDKGRITAEGANPLDHMGVYRADNGLFLAELDLTSRRWIKYQDYAQAVDLPPGWQQPPGRDVFRLSIYGRLYDYAQYGTLNGFADWVATAAMDAGRYEYRT